MTDQDSESDEEKPEERKPRFSANAWFANSPYVKMKLSNIDSFTRQISESIRPALRFQASIPSIYRSPLRDMMREYDEAMRAKLLPAFQTMRRAIQALWPENWGDARPGSIDELEEILLDEGIPLMWVPGPKTVEALFAAESASERRRIIGQRWRGIVNDCEAVLHGIKLRAIYEDREFALNCVHALRDGHNSPAQALAASLLDTILADHFEEQFRKTITSNWPKNGQRFDFDDYTFRVALTLAPVWCAHVHFKRKDGDPVPSDFARHASVHAVSRTQYNRINAVIGLMVVTSVIKFLDVELRRQQQAAHLT